MFLHISWADGEVYVHIQSAFLCARIRCAFITALKRAVFFLPECAFSKSKEKEVNQMKKLLVLLLALACVLGSLTSCEYIFGGGVDDEGDVKVVVENTDGSYELFKVSLEDVENKSEGAKGIIEHLSQNVELNVNMIDSTYGAYVSAIGSISESASMGIYVIVYTSVKTDGYEGSPTVEYDGMTLYQSGVGLSDMTVSAGTVILFRAEESPY